VLNPSDAFVQEANLRTIGWPWYTAIGTVINLVVGSLLAVRHRASVTGEGESGRR